MSTKKGRTPGGGTPLELSKGNDPCTQGEYETTLLHENTTQPHQGQGNPGVAGVPDIPDLDLIDTFSTEPEPLDFITPGHLAGTIAGNIGTGGVSKSMHGLETALAVTGGRGADIMGIWDIDEKQCPVATGHVLYLAAEDPELILRHRLHALGSRLHQDVRAEVAARLHIKPLLGQGMDIMSESWLTWLYRNAEGMRMVIIDTLRRVHQLDENLNDLMTILMGKLERLCQSLGCGALYVHHTSKFGAQNGDALSSRGASALTDNARLTTNMTVMQPSEAATYSVEDDARRDFVKMSWAKPNYSPVYPDLWLRRGEGGVLEPAHLGKPKPHGHGHGHGRQKQQQRSVLDEIESGGGKSEQQQQTYSF